MQGENDVDDFDADVKAAWDALSADKPATETVETVPAATEAPATETATDDKPAAEREDGRDERGRFRAKEPKEGDKPADAGSEPAAGPAGPVAEPTAEPAPATALAPPSSWSVPAKAAWEQLPPAVQEAIAKRETEVSSGFAQYAELKGVQQYAEMAKASGTTLKAALDAYVGIDQTLQRDPVAGMMQIAQNIGLDNARAGQLFAQLAEQLGHKITATAPQQGTGDAPAGVDPQLAQVLGPQLQQLLAPHLEKITGLEQTLKQRQEADQNARKAAADAIVAEFSSDPKNRYYANLEGEIGALLTTGLLAGGAVVKVQRTGDLRRDLQAAYDQACKLHPEVSAELSKAQRAKEESERKAREAEAAAKAKAASKSLTGNRMPGSTVKVETPAGGATDDIEADVRAAMAALRGA